MDTIYGSIIGECNSTLDHLHQHAQQVQQAPQVKQVPPVQHASTSGKKSVTNPLRVAQAVPSISGTANAITKM